MKNFIKAFISFVAFIILVMIIKGCIDNKREQDKIDNANTSIELLIKDPSYNDEWSNGKVVNYISVGFRNTGKEDVSEVTLKVHLYDASNVEIGVLDYSYKASPTVEIVKYGEQTYLYVMNLTDDEGRKATSYKITNLKVNGNDKEPIIKKVSSN